MDLVLQTGNEMASKMSHGEIFGIVSAIILTIMLIFWIVLFFICIFGNASNLFYQIIINESDLKTAGILITIISILVHIVAIWASITSKLIIVLLSIIVYLILLIVVVTTIGFIIGFYLWILAMFLLSVQAYTLTCC